MALCVSSLHDLKKSSNLDYTLGCLPAGQNSILSWGKCQTNPTTFFYLWLIRWWSRDSSGGFPCSVSHWTVTRNISLNWWLLVVQWWMWTLRKSVKQSLRCADSCQQYAWISLILGIWSNGNTGTVHVFQTCLFILGPGSFYVGYFWLQRAPQPAGHFWSPCQLLSQRCFG